MTYTPIQLTLAPGDRAYLVTERPGIVVAGRASEWTAARVTPLRSRPFDGYGFGKTRDDAVRSMK